MKNFFTYAYTLILASLFSMNSQATGVDSSGGGKGVVCRNSQNEVTSIELLDIWEARVLYGRSLAPSGKDLAEKIKNAIDRLKFSISLMDDESRSENSSGGMSPVDTVVYNLTDKARFFLEPSDEVKVIPGIVLTPTNDSYELAKPENCGIEQIVVYREFSANTEILVSKDLYDKLDENNKAALIAHEAFYSYLRGLTDEKDSIRTRRAIGYVFAGNSFPDFKTQLPAKHWSCSGKNQNVPKTQFYIFQDEKTQRAMVLSEMLAGQWSIGAVPAEFYNMDLKFVFNTSQCSNSEFLGTILGLPQAGPTDYDKNEGFFMKCESGHPSYYYRSAGFSNKLDVDPLNDLKVDCFWEEK